MSGIGLEGRPVKLTRQNSCKLLLVAVLIGFLSTALWGQAASDDKSVSNAGAQAPTSNADAPKPHDSTFVIGNDDVLAINVWKEPDISRSIPVRSDGKISLPLVGEVQAAGITPLKLEQDIAARLKNYIAEPEVTVIVQQVNSQKFNILGQINRPGSYPLATSPTVLDAIAVAGGFRVLSRDVPPAVSIPGFVGEFSEQISRIRSA